MSGINRSSRHMYSGEHAIDNGTAEMLERLAQTRLTEDAKRASCQCREPVRLRRYMGQWVCACGRFMGGKT